MIQGDLTSCLKPNSIDMIIFNPPYVVTPSAEVRTIIINSKHILERFDYLFHKKGKN